MPAAGRFGGHGLSLGLDDGERQAVFSIQHIIRKAGLPLGSGHVRDLYLFPAVVSEIPAENFEIHVDVLFSGEELGNVEWLETAALLMFFFTRGIFRTHGGDIRPQGFNLRILLLQEALLLPDLSLVDSDLLRRDSLFAEFALRVICTVAVVDPLHKFKKPGQSAHGPSGYISSPYVRRDSPASRCRQLPQSCDPRERKLSSWRALQVFLIRLPIVAVASKPI